MSASERPKKTETGRRRRRRENESRPIRWNDLLLVSAELFEEHGYDASTIQEIADRMGMLKGSLYHYITSKEELAYEIGLLAHNAALQYLHEYDPGPDVEIRERLASIMRGHIHFQVENRAFVSVYFNSARNLTDEHLDEIVTLRRAYNREFRQLVEIGQQEGKIRSDITSERLTILMLEMLSSVHRWFSPDRNWTVYDLAVSVVDMISHGTFTDPEKVLPEH